MSWITLPSVQGAVHSRNPNWGSLNGVASIAIGNIGPTLCQRATWRPDRPGVGLKTMSGGRDPGGVVQVFPRVSRIERRMIATGTLQSAHKFAPVEFARLMARSSRAFPPVLVSAMLELVSAKRT